MHACRIGLFCASVVVTAWGCAPPAESRRVSASHDVFTRRLQALYADQDGNGTIDQWTYLDGNRPLRGEKDTDGDGRVDRWEYFDEQGALSQIGTSSLNDGIEDTWTLPPQNGETRVDHARGRDRRIDRREFSANGVLIRAEEDTNGDGRIDRWDHFENGVLRRVEFDTTLNQARPNRRVLYDATGRFMRVEADVDLDGTFEATGEPAPVLKSGSR
jgi:hypothetical protein